MTQIVLEELACIARAVTTRVDLAPDIQTATRFRDVIC